MGVCDALSYRAAADKSIKFARAGYGVNKADGGFLIRSIAECYDMQPPLRSSAGNQHRKFAGLRQLISYVSNNTTGTSGA